MTANRSIAPLLLALAIAGCKQTKSDKAAPRRDAAIATVEICGTPVSVRETSVFCRSRFDNLERLAELPDLAELYLTAGETGTATRGRLTDHAALESLVGLESLFVEKVDLGSLAFLERMTALKDVTVKFADVGTALPRLENHAKLESVSLIGTAVSDVSALAALPALRHLTISNGPIGDLSAIAGLTGLTSLDVSFTNAGSLEPIAGLTRLETLDVGGTPITDLRPIAGLTRLRRLSVNRTNITSLEGVSSMRALERLVAAATPVSDLSPIAGLTSLADLNIAHTRVANLWPLAKLSKLESLNIMGAEVADLSPLIDLPALKYLTAFGEPPSDAEVRRLRSRRASLKVTR